LSDTVTTAEKNQKNIKKIYLGNANAGIFPKEVTGAGGGDDKLHGGSFSREGYKMS